MDGPLCSIITVTYVKWLATIWQFFFQFVNFYLLFQEQLDMTNTSASVGMQRINEVKNEVTKLAEEVNRIDYSVTTQEHELKTLSDHMCDLNSLKESVKEHSEEIIIIKEDYTRMKTHLNVSAKLELQVSNNSIH